VLTLERGMGPLVAARLCRRAIVASRPSLTCTQRFVKLHPTKKPYTFLLHLRVDALLARVGCPLGAAAFPGVLREAVSMTSPRVPALVKLRKGSNLLRDPAGSVSHGRLRLERHHAHDGEAVCAGISDHGRALGFR
jgi:hypothetical protein